MYNLRYGKLKIVWFKILYGSGKTLAMPQAILVTILKMLSFCGIVYCLR